MAVLWLKLILCPPRGGWSGAGDVCSRTHIYVRTAGNGMYDDAHKYVRATQRGLIKKVSCLYSLRNLNENKILW